MGTLVASALVAKVRADLVDGDAVTWTDADLLEDLNEALRALCEVKVDSYVLREPIPLEPGDEQTLPANGIALFSLGANAASRKGTRQVDLELLDAADPDWATRAAAVDVVHWVADPRDKTRFRVDPPNTGAGMVWGTYGAVPDPIEAGDPIPVGDSNEPALIARTLSAAYRRNTQRQDLAKTSGFEQQFLTLVGLASRGELAAAPKVSQSPGAA